MPAALQVSQQLAFQIGRPAHPLPTFDRLGQQGVMVGISMAEDEALLPVGRVPVHHRYTRLPAAFPDHTLGDINTVVKNRYLVLPLAQQSLSGETGKKGRVKV